MISRELEVEILRLHRAEHWKIGTIAAQLHTHHSTVRRVLMQAGLVQAPELPRASMVDPYKGFILETLTKYPTLRASRLYAMVRERGYRGSATHFRHRVAQLRPRPPAEAYRSIAARP
ncbi:MAG: transposase [Pseudomonadota bacterium]|nr:transposase [Pseudomonadota bacterium]